MYCLAYATATLGLLFQKNMIARRGSSVDMPFPTLQQQCFAGRQYDVSMPQSKKQSDNVKAEACQTC